MTSIELQVTSGTVLLMVAVAAYEPWSTLLIGGL